MVARDRVGADNAILAFGTETDANVVVKTADRKQD